MPINRLKTVLAEFNKSKAAEMKYEDADFCVTLKRGASSADEEIDDGKEWILSPIVGTFYAESKVGQKISAGKPLCVIESMKIMNKICAPADLKVKSIKYHDGDLVEFNSKLIEVEYL